MRSFLVIFWRKVGHVFRCTQYRYQCLEKWTQKSLGQDRRFLGCSFGCLGGVWVGLIFLHSKTILVIASVNRRHFEHFYNVSSYIYFYFTTKEGFGYRKKHISQSKSNIWVKKNKRKAYFGWKSPGSVAEGRQGSEEFLVVILKSVCTCFVLDD